MTSKAAFAKYTKTFNRSNNIGLGIVNFFIKINNPHKYLEFCLEFINDTDTAFYTALMQKITDAFGDNKITKLFSTKILIIYYFILKIYYIENPKMDHKDLFQRTDVTFKEGKSRHVFFRHFKKAYKDSVRAEMVNGNVIYEIKYTETTPLLIITPIRIRMNLLECSEAEYLLIKELVPFREIRKIRKQVEMMYDTKHTFRNVLGRYDINQDIDKLCNYFIEIRGSINLQYGLYYTYFVKTLIDKLSFEDFKKIREYKNNILSSDESDLDEPSEDETTECETSDSGIEYELEEDPPEEADWEYIIHN